jgi:hypothetical protein
MNDDTTSVLSEDEADKFLRKEVDGYVNWFWEQSDRYEIDARRYELWIIFSAALAAAVAAFPEEALLRPYWSKSGDFMKWLVVLLSGSASLFATLRSRLGLEELYRLREEGPVRLVAIQKRTRLDLTECPMSREERRKYKKSIVEEIATIERKYGSGKFPHRTETVIPSSP